MIYVSLPELTTPELLRWQTRAERETLALTVTAAAGGTIKFKENLYKKHVRDLLFAAFQGKCAYCESKICDTQPGDIDHFRPKGALTDENDKEVILEDGRTHRGYYWLAYSLANLLPTCRTCNSGTTGTDGRRLGKLTRFPIQGVRVSEPGHSEESLSGEQPVFLHPCFDHPEEELDFDRQTGHLLGLTSRATLFINLMGLNRGGLPVRRKEVYYNVKAYVIDAWRARLERDLDLACLREQWLEGVKLGRTEYAMVGRKGLDEMDEALNEIGSMLPQLRKARPAQAPSTRKKQRRRSNQTFGTR